MMSFFLQSRLPGPRELQPRGLLHPHAGDRVRRRTRGVVGTRRRNLQTVSSECWGPGTQFANGCWGKGKDYTRFNSRFVVVGIFLVMGPKKIKEGSHPPWKGDELFFCRLFEGAPKNCQCNYQMPNRRNFQYSPNKNWIFIQTKQKWNNKFF